MTPRPHPDLSEWNRHLHAFAHLQTQTPLAPGSLAGLYFGVKDVIDVAGMPTRNGSAVCDGAGPVPRDATIVHRLRAAGATVVGKTTTTEFAFTDPTDCRNPHDLTRSPGGSSSGSGAAVGAGIVDFALGTQTAGSLCRPAAYCGAVGLKPGHGRLPTDGITPLAPGFDTPGVIARSVDIARQAFETMSETALDKVETSGLNILSGLFGHHILPEADQHDALQAATDACRDGGTSVRAAALRADVDTIVADHRTVMIHEAAAAHGAYLEDGRSALLRPGFLAALQAGRAVSPGQADAARARLRDARAVFWTEHAEADVIVTLPVPEGAPPLDGTTGYQHWLTPWTVFGGPLVCLPWGLDRIGRPRAIMLAARPGGEASALALAQDLEGRAPSLPLPGLASASGTG
ncbi:MAG: amidase [Rhodobacteraceae bacterium]|nr:amidase [Paracoccaceae bacterium]